jgi:hypothetical protein
LHIAATISFEQYEATLAAMRKPAERKFGKTKWLRVFFITVFSFSLAIAIKTPIHARISARWFHPARLASFCSLVMGKIKDSVLFEAGLQGTRETVEWSANGN